MHDAVLRSVFNALLVGTGLFQDPGPVIDVQSTGRSDQTFRFVEFEHPLAASVAISFSGMKIAGVVVRVQRTKEYDLGPGSGKPQDAGAPTVLLGSSAAAAAASDNPLLRMAAGGLAAAPAPAAVPSGSAADAQSGLPAVVRTGDAFVPREDASGAIQFLMERRNTLRTPSLGLSTEQSTAAAACAAVPFGTGIPGVPSLLAAAAATAIRGGVPVRGVPGEPIVAVELHPDHGTSDAGPRHPRRAPEHVLRGTTEAGSPWTEVYRRTGRSGAPKESLTAALLEQISPKFADLGVAPLHLRGVPGLPARCLVAASTRILALHNLASESDVKKPSAYDDILEDAIAFVESLLKQWQAEEQPGDRAGGSASSSLSDGHGGEASAAMDGDGGTSEGAAHALAGRKRNRWEAGMADAQGSGVGRSASLLSWKAPRPSGARRLPPFAWDDAAEHDFDEKCRLGEPDAETMAVFAGKSVVQSVTGDRFLAAVDRRRGPEMQVGGLGSLFLELDSVATAVRLQQELSGRGFGDRIVVTSFLSEDDYASDWFWGYGREYDASAEAKALRDGSKPALPSDSSVAAAQSGPAHSDAVAAAMTPAQVVQHDPSKRLTSPQFAHDPRMREAELARWGKESATQGPRALTNG